jgi:Ca2+/Na+ antiporter
MLRHLKIVQAFDLPAPVTVCGILLAAALTKEGHSAWAIAALLLLYIFTVAIQFCKQSGDLRAQTVSLNHLQSPAGGR